jgi:hypothetical protein
MNEAKLKTNLKKLLKQKDDVLIILKDGTVYKVPSANMGFIENSYKIGQGMGIFLDLAGKSGLERRIEALESEQTAIKNERDVLKIAVKNLKTKDEGEDNFIEHVGRWYKDLWRKYETNFDKLYKISRAIQKLDPAIIIEPIVNVSTWDEEEAKCMIAATKTFPCYKYRDDYGDMTDGPPFRIGVELLLKKEILIGEAYLLGNNEIKPVAVGENDAAGLLCAPRFSGFVKSLDGTLAENIVTAIDYARSVVHGAVSADNERPQDFKHNVVNVGIKRDKDD